MNRSISLKVCLLSAITVAAAPKGADHGVLLDVQPAAAPVLALKYQLLPEVAEMNPGNAYPAYLKCFGEQHRFFFSKEGSEEREKWLKSPLTDIKPGSLKDYGGSALRQADHAARLEYCDWNILPQMREHGYMLLLPEVQQLRTLASALAVRCRGQIVDKDYDGAVKTLKTMFALARHLGEHPTIITGLVGAAIAQVALNALEELIQQPGAPNLYWALTQLPAQIVDYRKGVSADRSITEATFGHLMDNKRAWSADDVALATKKFKELGALMELKPEERAMGEQWLRDRVKNAEWQSAAKKSLSEAGYPADVLAKYPPEQVLFFYLYQKARVHHDEAVKWMGVPYWQAETAILELRKEPMDFEEKITRQMIFAVEKVKGAHTKLEQRVALFRVIEAIRLDAAKNGGKLPEKLSDLSVPVPNDPATGKHFTYKLDGMTATLEGKAISTLTAGQTKYTYEIRLRK